MSLPKPNPDALLHEQTDTSPITEVTPNTFVINLQQAIFGLDTGITEVNNLRQPYEKNTARLSPLRHLLTGMELNRQDMQLILNQAKAIKKHRPFIVRP